MSSPTPFSSPISSQSHPQVRRLLDQEAASHAAIDDRVPARPTIAHISHGFLYQGSTNQSLEQHIHLIQGRVQHYFKSDRPIVKRLDLLFEIENFVLKIFDKPQFQKQVTTLMDLHRQLEPPRPGR